MKVISAREFRTRQGIYFDMAISGEDVVITSREYGSFKIIPITKEDTIMSKEDFYAKLDKSLHQIEKGEAISFNSADDAIKYFDSL